MPYLFARLISIEHGDTTILDGGLVFSGGAQVTVYPVLFHQGFQYRLPRQVQLQTDPSRFDITNIIFGAYIVRQIYGKTGISSRTSKTNFLRLDQHDFIIWEVQRQLPGRGKTGETGTYHNPACVSITGMTRPGLARLAQMKPTACRIIRRCGSYFCHLAASDLLFLSFQSLEMLLSRHNRPFLSAIDNVKL